MQSDGRGPNTPLPPVAGTFRIEAPGSAVDKRVTMRNDRIHVRVDYDDGAVVEWIFDPSGSTEIVTNRMFVIDPVNRSMRVLGRMTASSSAPRDPAPSADGRYSLGPRSSPTEPQLPAQSVGRPRRD